jgi:hypothetical protein
MLTGRPGCSIPVRPQAEGLVMDRPTFEDTYPKYPFSELVRVGLAAGRWILRMLHLAEASRPKPRDPGKTEIYAD